MNSNENKFDDYNRLELNDLDDKVAESCELLISESLNGENNIQIPIKSMLNEASFDMSSNLNQKKINKTKNSLRHNYLVLDQNNNKLLIDSHKNLKCTVAEEEAKLFRILKFEEIKKNEPEPSKILNIEQGITFQWKETWKDQRKKIKKLNKLKIDRKIVLADKECQVYAQVDRMLGQSYLEATCYEKLDGILMQCKLLCHIRGKMCQKNWIFKNDIVLVSLREFEHDNSKTHMGDIIHVYLRYERRLLKSWGKIPMECEDFVELVSKPKIKRKKRFHKKINITNKSNLKDFKVLNSTTKMEESDFKNGRIVCFGSQKKSFFRFLIGNLTLEFVYPNIPQRRSQPASSIKNVKKQNSQTSECQPFPESNKKKNNKTKPIHNKENAQNTKATKKNKTSQQPKQSKKNKIPKAPKQAKKPKSAN